jgi:hypothetical protein
MRSTKNFEEPGKHVEMNVSLHILIMIQPFLVLLH